MYALYANRCSRLHFVFREMLGDAVLGDDTALLGDTATGGAKLCAVISGSCSTPHMLHIFIFQIEIFQNWIEADCG